MTHNLEHIRDVLESEGYILNTTTSDYEYVYQKEDIQITIHKL